MTTKIANTIKSDLWLNSLIESLKDSEYAAEYLTVILENDPESEQILRVTLQDIIKARQHDNCLSEEALQYYQKLEQLFAKNEEQSIYLFINLLNALGFKVNIINNLFGG
jgi:DNA-binding phage protein